MATLVNISLMPATVKPPYRNSAGFDDDRVPRVAMFVKNIQATPPRGYRELVRAMSDFWVSVGSREVCSACFRGEIHPDQKGCCVGQCSHLTDQGCSLKPIGCAAFDCGDLRGLIPQQFQVRYSRLSRRLYDFLSTVCPGGTFYLDWAYSGNMERQWSEQELERLQHFIRCYNRLTAAIKRLDYKPDYAKLFRHTQWQKDQQQAPRQAIRQY